METGIQSSFIPKEAGKVSAVARPISGGGGLAELFVLAAVILLVASVALAGGVFLYQQFLRQQATSKAEQLKRAEAAFEPSLIQQLTRLDDRMHAADTLLNAHLAPSVFFSSLDQATLTTVSFTDLVIAATDANQTNIKMNGVARSVNSVALQADLFGKNAVISNPIFSNIDHQPDGVHFSLTALINTAAMNYGQVLTSSQQAASPAPQVQTPATTTTPASPFLDKNTPAATDGGVKQ